MEIDPNEKRAQSLRRGLVLSLVGLQLATVLLILFLIHFSNNKGIDQQISLLLQNALNESKEHTKGFLEPAFRNVQITTELFQTDDLSLADTAQLERYFLTQLKMNPEINGMYLATESGDFFFVTRSVEGEKEGFLTKQITSENPGKASFYWRYESSKITESRINQKDDYNALERPWYRQAVSQGKLVWTEPYIFYTSNHPGITVAMPIFKDGEIIGVVGADVELTNLSRFLADLKVYGAVSVFMVSGSGNFVAAPPMIADNLLLKTLNVQESGDSSLRLDKQAATHFLDSTDRLSKAESSSSFNFDDETHVVRYEPFLLNQGPEWIIGAYAPRSVFLTEVRASEMRGTSIALTILMLSIVIGWLLIKKTWLPFERFFHDVITDQLTGLFNRRYLENIGSRMYIRLLRQQQDRISIAVIDLDNFTKINNEFGHSKGNEILAAFADFLRETLRPEDIITRYSGDTFVIIFPGLEHANAMGVIDRMRIQIDSWPLTIGNLLVRLTFSAGVETLDQDSTIADAAFTDFIDVARRAMSDAKGIGGDQVVSAKDRNYQPKPKAGFPSKEQ